MSPNFDIPRGSTYPGNNNSGHSNLIPRSETPYYFTPSATQSPVVKMENLGHSHSHAHTNSNPHSHSHSHPSMPSDWPLMENFYLQASGFHQAELTAPTTAMRNTACNSSRLTTSSVSPAGYHGEQGSLQMGGDVNGHSNTNNNISLGKFNGQNSTYATNPNVAKRADTPDFPGDILGQQGFHTTQQPTYFSPKNAKNHYESSCHSSKTQYRAVSSIPPSNPTYFRFPSAGAMSLSSYETRTFPSYPELHDGLQDHQDNSNMQTHRYPSPDPLSGNPYNSQGIDTQQPGIDLDLPELVAKEESDPASPGRSRPIPKPDREITKSDDGRFLCTWVGCLEDVKAFNRKCEWSKHMDKHDRPYKCPADGCEKLPGFTYSGGLLRHQREVHNLHGGPRKQLNCPHPNCKRHSGKGFSRQENLNEHMRRVHTPGEAENGGGDDTEEDGSERAGMKRKRGPGNTNESEFRTEMARLRTENEELRRQSDLQSQQTAELMRQLQSLQALVGSRMGPGPAPQALM